MSRCWQFGALVSALVLNLGCSVKASVQPEFSTTENDRPCLILLHGLGVNQWQMLGMSMNLDDHYFVVNQSYPSTQASLQQLAPPYINEALTACGSHLDNGLDVVTHSMGGLLLRQYLSQFELPQLRRVVMIAPPNNGSEIVDRMRDQSWFSRWMGPAAMQLGTRGVAEDLPEPSVPFAVIAGDLNIEPWFRDDFNGPNDGRVTVESTKLPGMDDFIVISQHHSLLLWDPRSWRQVRHFLFYGAFEHEAELADETTEEG